MAVEEATIQLMKQYDFYAYMLAQFDRVYDSKQIAVAGVKPNKNKTDITLTVNPELLSALPAKTRVAVLIHEVHHVLNKHFLRGEALGDFSRKMNVAADLAINSMIREEFPQLSKMPWCYPGAFELPEDKIFEWYYRNIPEQDECIGIGISGEDRSDAEGGAKESHKDWKDFDESFDKIIDAAIKDKVKQSVRRAGNIPGEAKELVDAILKEPTIPWQHLVKMFSNRVLSSTRSCSWKRKNRRTSCEYIPGKKRNWETDLVLIIDVSGSVSAEDFIEFKSEIKQIFSLVKSLVIIMVDGKIQAEYTLRNIDQIELIGRGGTCFIPALERAKELNPGGIIFFTDGYPCDGWGDPMNNIMWVICSGGISLDEVPYGHKAKIEEK